MLKDKLRKKKTSEGIFLPYMALISADRLFTVEKSKILKNAVREIILG